MQKVGNPLETKHDENIWLSSHEPSKRKIYPCLTAAYYYTFCSHH